MVDFIFFIRFNNLVIFFDDSKTSVNNNKENNFDDNITFNKNNNKKSKVKGPKHVKYYRENKYHSKEKPNFSISAINNQGIDDVLTRLADIIDSSSHSVCLFC